MNDENENLANAVTTDNYESTNPAPKMYKGIDHENQRYPYCIVWTPIPLISWMIPIIGHTGICS
jgi:hypothetical protein